ncbi:hypothetical protein MAR_029585 [Mya arenaria]|uniref:Uncharacterized protein n=1 Tax=Mya arenaria TaxID=6604 RepID=A0ABY7DKM8_MYAAR|nr:hypothetical protein MAR_029585 [Mya arenaria]
MGNRYCHSYLPPVHTSKCMGNRYCHSYLPPVHTSKCMGNRYCRHSYLPPVSLLLVLSSLVSAACVTITSKCMGNRCSRHLYLPPVSLLLVNVWATGIVVTRICRLCHYY